MGWQAGQGSGPGPRDPRLAWFDVGGEQAACPPSGRLAALLDELCGPGRRCAGATGGERTGLLRAWAAIESWAAAGKLSVVREMTCCEDTPGGDGGWPGECPESPQFEVALALACSARSAERLAWVAWQLQARLPGTGALLADGTLSYAKARAIAEAFELLSDADAARAEALIAGQLAGKTYIQVVNLAVKAALTVDPGLAERRRKAAERHAARVEFFREPSGTAALAGHDLPPDEALAAYGNVCARAGQYKQAPVLAKTGMDVLRAYAYLDILNGVTPEARIAAAVERAAAEKGPGEKGPAAEGQAEPEAGDGPAGDGPGDNGGPAGDGPGDDGCPACDGPGQSGSGGDEDDPDDNDGPGHGARDGGRRDDISSADPVDADPVGGEDGAGSGDGDASGDRGRGDAGGSGDGTADNPGDDDDGRDGGGDGADTDDRDVGASDGGASGVGASDVGASDVGASGGDGDGGGDDDDGGGGGGGGGPGRGLAPAGPGPGFGAARTAPPAMPSAMPSAVPSAVPSAPPPRPVDLVIPLAVLLGLADRPGEAYRFGLTDPGLTRDLAAAAARSPLSEWCLTVTSPEGYAIGHGCLRSARGSLYPPDALLVAGTPLAGLTARVNLTIPAAMLPGLAARAGLAGDTGLAADVGPAGPAGASPWAFTALGGLPPPGGYGSRGYGTWRLSLPGGPDLTTQAGPVPVFDCDHRHESHAYQPNAALRHLVQVRDGTCTCPVCSRHARESDFEHAVPYHKGGRTCACNAGARSRQCHRVKQSRGWKVTQPRPGWHRWETPGGWTYTQEPKRYPA